MTGDVEEAILEMYLFSGISVREIAGVPDALSKVRVVKDAGTLTVSPEPQETSEYLEAPHDETVELPDGTEAKLRYMEPTEDNVITGEWYQELRPLGVLEEPGWPELGVYRSHL